MISEKLTEWLAYFSSVTRDQMVHKWLAKNVARRAHVTAFQTDAEHMYVCWGMSSTHCLTCLLGGPVSSCICSHSGLHYGFNMSIKDSEYKNSDAFHIIHRHEHTQPMTTSLCDVWDRACVESVHLWLGRTWLHPSTDRAGLNALGPSSLWLLWRLNGTLRGESRAEGKLVAGVLGGVLPLIVLHIISDSLQ